MVTENPRLSKEQKIGLVLLSAFVLLAVTLGLIQMRNTLYSPFALNTSIPPMIGQEVNTPEALRYRDTDIDGLSDYDELYVFTTSPYLADSDSDGITDKQEVDQGKNPNCAEGKNCIGNVGENASTVAGKPDMPTPFNLSDYDLSVFDSIVADPDELRELLIQSGLEESVVNMISDEELIQISTGIFTSSTIMEDITTATGTQNVTATAQFINELMSE